MKKNTFVEGTMIAYIAILITKILGALYVIPFYKIIGTEGGVLYSYAYSVYNLFLNISTSGIPTAVSIIISEYNALKMFKSREHTYNVANKVIACISFLAFLIMFIFAKYIALFFVSDIGSNSTDSIVLVIRVISFCLLIIPFLSVTRGYLQGNKYVGISSFSQLIEQVVRIFIVLVGSYIAINILNLSVPIGVAVALSGTVISGVVAYIFLKRKIKKHQEDFSIKDSIPNEQIASSKEIIKKIIKHAIPVIIISVTQNIYEIIDLKLIIKGLYMCGFTASNSELLGSIVVTWAPKICMVINALAISLSSSIIPFIVDSYVKKDNQELNNKFNQALNTILFIAIPITIYIIAFSSPIYYIFYGSSPYGGTVLKVEAIVSTFFSIQMVINMILQGMKKYKTVYLNSIAGIVINSLLDIPIILLLNKLNFYPYIGSLISTLIGLFVSITIALVSLKKEFKFKYLGFKTIKSMLFPLLGMIVVLVIGNLLFKSSSYLITLINLAIWGILSILTYILIAYKNGSLTNILGKDFLNKILTKLKIKKVSN